MGHVDGCVQVCGTQIANDLVNHFKPLKDSQLTLIAKASMAAFMGIAAVLAYATFNMARLQLLAQMSYYLIIQLSIPLFLGMFTKFGNRYGAISGMISGSAGRDRADHQVDRRHPGAGRPHGRGRRSWCQLRARTSSSRP